MLLRLAFVATVFLGFLTGPAGAEDFSSGQLEFFEARVRPLLIEHCYTCHSVDAKSVKGGLRLDSRELTLRGGDTGTAAIPGDVDQSLLIQSVRYESYEMPPKGKLKPDQIAVLERWVKLGLPWPTLDQSAAPSTAEGYDWQRVRDNHWAWQPVRDAQPPQAQPGDRIGNPIDQFITARLREHGLSQAPPASAEILVRRMYLDLTGLPPTPQQIDDWCDRLRGPGQQPALDDRAVGELVDTLLASPAYGERWARYWLDVARYSDGFGGFSDNQGMPNAWRYRDWVVAAFNQDVPYDEFVRLQIAGDLLAADTGEKGQAIGTGFLALGPTYRSDGGDPESVAQAKGETLDDRVDTLSRAFLGLTVSCARCHDHKFDPIPTQDYYSLAGIFNNSRNVEYALASDADVKAYREHQAQLKKLQDEAKKIRQTGKKEKRELSATEQGGLNELQSRIALLQKSAPEKYDTAHAIGDATAEDMHVALRGNLLKQGELAPRRFLRLLSGEERSHFQKGSGRRQLADAIADSKNPLTARVIVNRIWQQHFAQALVRSPSNFGKLGQLPSHPDLLDWLTQRFVEEGWSIKSLHRTMMTSATYRSSSAFREKDFASDGDNRWLWRMTPRRMDVETWRDALLSVTGELNRAPGGPPIADIVRSRRRTLYAKVSRNGDVFDSDAFLQIFDFPVPRATHAQRTSSVVPQQFLFMLNSEFMVERAKALAQRAAHSGLLGADRLQLVYRLLYGRYATDEELAIGLAFVQDESDNVRELSRWQQYCQVLLSANEFMYIR